MSAVVSTYSDADYTCLPCLSHKSVLAGLSPATIVDIAGRALNFWSYQTSQESAFTNIMLRNCQERVSTLEKQMQNLVQEANSQIELFHGKNQTLLEQLDAEKQKSRELYEGLKENQKLYADLKVRYDKVKQKAYLGDFERIEKDTAHGLAAVDNGNIGRTGPVAFQPREEEMPSIYMGQRSSPIRMEHSDNIDSSGWILPENTKSSGGWTGGGSPGTSNWRPPSVAGSVTTDRSERSSSTRPITRNNMGNVPRMSMRTPTKNKQRQEQHGSDEEFSRPTQMPTMRPSTTSGSAGISISSRGGSGGGAGALRYNRPRSLEHGRTATPGGVIGNLSRAQQEAQQQPRFVQSSSFISAPSPRPVRTSWTPQPSRSNAFVPARVPTSSGSHGNMQQRFH